MIGGWFVIGTDGFLSSWRGPARGARGPGADGGGRHVSQVRAEQVRLLFEQLPPALIATQVLGLLVVYVFWNQLPQYRLLEWLVTLIAVSAGRVWLRRAYFKARPGPGDAVRWARRFLIGVVFSGIVWGMVGLLPLPRDAVLEQMFVVFVLAGLAAGGMAT